MLRPRVIPCLLLHNDGLVKTVRFGSPKYVGDPLNTVRIFNEKVVDELIVLDIDATRLGRVPNVARISQLAAECRMPLCYGGGVRAVEHIERIISLGIEKVAIGAAAVETPCLVDAAAGRVGAQSVVVVLDVTSAGANAKPEVAIRNGTERTGLDPVSFAREMESRGAGELLVNAVDRDGTMSGYDLDLVESIRNAVSLPLTVLGGAGSLDDMVAAVSRFGVMGVAAGSLFVFKGKYRAVLLSYPTESSRDELAAAAPQ